MGNWVYNSFIIMFGNIINSNTNHFHPSRECYVLVYIHTLVSLANIHIFLSKWVKLLFFFLISV